MKKNKRMLAALLAVLLLPVTAFENRMQVRADSTALASSYNSDVGNLAFVTDVEDQFQTNYCWAYMADAVLESYLLKTGRAMQVDFSEADMISQLSGGSTYGFNDLMEGGSYHQAVAYWTRGSYYGPRLESNGSAADYYVSETAELGRYQRGDAQSRQNYIQSIKNLVALYGAAGVSIYFNAGDRMAMAKDGAYYYPESSSPGVNHGVTVVGWNDDYQPQWFYNPLTMPHQPQKKGAFLVKNSWGRSDSASIGGNTGYYWISYENYFQDAFAVTQVMERSKLYDYIYETDYRGLSEYTAGSSYSQTYKLSTSVQMLSGFATYVQAGASYRFYVNGQELTQLGGTMAHSGYHTFQLMNPIAVAGTLELRAEVEGSVEAVPIACSAGSHVPDSGNVCLKAFTITTAGSNSWTANPVTPGSTVTGVTVSPNNCTVRQGARQVFTANVTGTGQPSQRVNWQLSGSSSAGTRLIDGILYVGADEGSDVLYVYANSDADSAKGAAARVTVIKTSDSTNASLYTVTFVNEGEVCKRQSVRYGEPAAAPAVTKDGYSLSWDRAYNYITENLVVTAVWTKIETNTINETNDANINGSNGREDSSDGAVQTGTVDKGIYNCWEDGTAQYAKCTTKSRTSLSIPASVKIGGRTYTVTSMEENCILKNTKVKTVTIGKNITEIGENAFYGCKQLKKIKIKSEKVEYIGDDAFQGIYAKAVIYVPRSCLAEYRAMVRASGNTKARVKAYD